MVNRWDRGYATGTDCDACAIALSDIRVSVQMLLCVHLVGQEGSASHYLTITRPEKERSSIWSIGPHRSWLLTVISCRLPGIVSGGISAMYCRRSPAGPAAPPPNG